MASRIPEALRPSSEEGESRQEGPGYVQLSGAQPVPGYLAHNLSLMNYTSNQPRGQEESSPIDCGMNPVTKRIINAAQTNYWSAVWDSPIEVNMVLDGEETAYREQREQRVLEHGGVSPGVTKEDAQEMDRVYDFYADKFMNFIEEKGLVQEGSLPEHMLKGEGAFQPFPKLYVEKQDELAENLADRIVNDQFLDNVAERVEQRIEN